jgi:DNA-binding NtrC family response regulator
MNNILIIDDEKAICSSLSFALENEYNVFVAQTPEEALKCYFNSNIDIVLLDLKLGEYNGMDVLKRIRESNKEAVVIIMTAYGTIKSSVEAMKAGAYHYITKPIDIEELKILISKGLDYIKMNTTIRLLNEEINRKYGYQGIIGKSESIKKVFDVISKVKDIDSNIIITGESGTGKELVAKAIHFQSKRRKERFETVNCASIPKSLLESELFGYEKGAFTGALKNKKGKFELAHRGTLFLDEVGEMEYFLQSKLLRFIQEKEIVPLGATEKKKIDVRIIAATNKDLKEEIKKGNFREDLYYRLNVISIHLPPLRERKEDIPLLIKHFIDKFNRSMGKQIKGIDKNALKCLESYPFPGNIRELENIIERAVALTNAHYITIEDLPVEVLEKRDLYLETENLIPVFYGEDLKTIEKKVILTTLNKTNGNRKKTAEILGISERGLRYKIKEYS